MHCDVIARSMHIDISAHSSSHLRFAELHGLVVREIASRRPCLVCRGGALLPRGSRRRDRRQDILPRQAVVVVAEHLDHVPRLARCEGGMDCCGELEGLGRVDLVIPRSPV